jgi:hypothetical protein
LPENGKMLWAKEQRREQLITIFIRYGAAGECGGGANLIDVSLSSLRIDIFE